MASEITFDLAHMSTSDMLESSMAREPQGITINQGSLNNLIDCVTQMKQELQQISMAQMNHEKLKKEDRHSTVGPPGLLLEDVQEFQSCLSSSNCDRLLEMVNQCPPQLFFHTFDEEYSRSALHVAVLQGSLTLIRTLLKELQELCGGNNFKLVKHDFILKEDKFGLCAADMATLIANKEIISYLEEGLQVYDYPEDDILFCRSPTSEDEKMKLLDEASLLLGKPAPTPSDQNTGQLTLREWLLNNDVKFVYCLHEVAMNMSLSQKKALEFVEYVYDNGDFHFLEPLFKVRDSFGRSPLHVHDNADCKTLFKKLVDNFPTLDWNMLDFCGRTPLHWAAATGHVKVVTILANQKAIDLNATYSNFCEEKMKISTNFNYGGVYEVTPLHLAVIHNHLKVVKALLKVPKDRKLNVNAICWRPHYETSMSFTWTPIQLAVYMGYERILKELLKDLRTYDPGFNNENKEAPSGHNMIPALHLATSQFHSIAVKVLATSKRTNILVKTQDGDTTLHYATMHAHGQLQVHASLCDYITMSHFISSPSKSRKPSHRDMTACIETLFFFGLDVEEAIKVGKIPTLHPLSSENMQTWWLGKIAKEDQENKNNLLIAANAVSVTAALVATLSFVGPLQPPLGLLDDGNKTWLDGYSQVKHTPVEIFLFCNSLSFYFAIAAIVFAMLPSWPIPRDWRAKEVRIAYKCIQVAVLFLLGSIIFVICAFSVANIAIVPNKRWRYKAIAVISTSLGVFICFIILFLSLMRLLRLLSPESEVAKKISNFAIQILLQE